VVLLGPQFRPLTVAHFLETLRGHSRLGNLQQHPPATLRLPLRFDQHNLLAKSPPVVTIVTPTLNQRRFIEFTVESILGQSYPCLEYIVQDGGSTDGTIDVLEDYQAAGELTYHSAHDSGLAQAINRGLAVSHGEIMAYLNSDDLLLPGSVNFIVQWFLDHPEVDVVYGHRVLIDDFGYQIGRWILPPHDRRVMYWEDYIPQETLFWRRRIWDRVGAAIDETFQFAVDWDLILRFAEAGARFARVPRLLGAFRVHRGQKTVREMASVGQREVNRILRRYHGYVPASSEIDRKVAAYQLRHALYDWAYARGYLRY
jgi:glycosyltransferase involved in cell wall biosynthesis